MNQELRFLLAEAGYDRAFARDVWESVMIVNNYGSVPIPQGLSHDFAQKGFKMLLLDERGRPVHFARCGAASDLVLQREGHILESLCRVPELATTIPRTRSVSSQALRVQLNAYIPGGTYEQFVHRQSAREWTKSVIEILGVRSLVSRAAAEVLPELVRGGATLRPAEEASASLRLLREVGIEAAEIAALEGALNSVGEFPRVLQHGDLWPGNVLSHDHFWWLIDFAEFGLVQMPMYDVFHMLESNPGRRAPGTRHAWLTLGAGAVRDRWTTASREVVASQAKLLGLGPREIGATLVYYLIHISAYRLREGVPREFGEAYIRELIRVAEQLRRGLPLERLIAF